MFLLLSKSAISQNWDQVKLARMNYSDNGLQIIYGQLLRERIIRSVLGAGQAWPVRDATLAWYQPLLDLEFPQNFTFRKSVHIHLYQLDFLNPRVHSLLRPVQSLCFLSYCLPNQFCTIVRVLLVSPSYPLSTPKVQPINFNYGTSSLGSPLSQHHLARAFNLDAKDTPDMS